MLQFLNKTIQTMCCIIVSSYFLSAQDSVFIESKIWYRDSVRTIHYTDWKKFGSQTVDLLKGFQPVEKQEESLYGGDKTHQFKATGYFRTEKQGNRNWVVDPQGYAYVVTAVTSIRQGKSPNNQKAFTEKFKTADKWADETHNVLKDLGFNTAGSWSDLEAIVPYNKANPKESIVFTTQLNFLTTFAQSVKKRDPTRKNADVLSFIFDADFPKFCDEHAAKNAAIYRNDPNLLGHFSDNELPFMSKTIEDIWTSTQENDAAHIAIVDFLKEKNAPNLKTLSKADQEIFIGRLAALYYKNVSEALKKYDPNHMYIGSRLHASAKNNKAIFTEGVEKYVDIVSINYYGYWQPQTKHIEEWAKWTSKPFFITEFYTKGDDVGMKNISGAGWLVRTQADRGIHYQNFCLQLLKAPNCVGWHWFRYQDNDPNDNTADPSNQDSNKGLVNTEYAVYKALGDKMKQLNLNKYKLIEFFDKKK